MKKKNQGKAIIKLDYSLNCIDFIEFIGKHYNTDNKKINMDFENYLENC